MLSGSASVEELAAGAPVMTSMDAAAVELHDAEILQAVFEMAYGTREATLPPGLHPTTPPLLVILAWRLAESPWGPFSMAQVRVSCRSGVRPRGFVAGCVVGGADAAAALSAHWGFPARTGSVHLARFYDAAVLEVAPGLVLTATDPDPLAPGDVQYTVTTTLAHTPRGLRLVQVEPEYELRRVERVRPRLDRFDPAAWTHLPLAPVHAVSASVAVGKIAIPRLRYMSRPDVPAFEGTEAVV